MMTFRNFPKDPFGEDLFKRPGDRHLRARVGRGSASSAQRGAATDKERAYFDDDDNDMATMAAAPPQPTTTTLSIAAYDVGHNINSSSSSKGIVEDKHMDERLRVSEMVVRRNRFSTRDGSGRVTHRRAFPLEVDPDAATILTADERAAASTPGARGASGPASDPAAADTHVFRSQRRTRLLDRMKGSGRATSVRIFPLSVAECQQRQREEDEHATARKPAMEIVPYAGDGCEPTVVELVDPPPAFDDPDDHDGGLPEAWGGEDVAMEVMEEAQATAAPAPRARRPRGEPHKRLRNYCKNRKSLAAHGLRMADDAEKEIKVRRSTRTRQKPLQYWRNEKVEYGREHRSLPTIAAVALRSPDECWPAPGPFHLKRGRRTRSRIAKLEAPGSGSPPPARADADGSSTETASDSDASSERGDATP